MPNGLLLAYRSSRTPCSGIVATGDAGLRHSRTHPRTAVLAALPIGPRLLSGSAPGSARGWPRGQPPTPLRFPPGAPTVRCWPAPGGRPGAETPIDGVSCDAVPTERLAPPSSVREVLGPHAALGLGTAEVRRPRAQRRRAPRRRLHRGPAKCGTAAPGAGAGRRGAARHPLVLPVRRSAGSWTPCCAASTTSVTTNHPCGWWRPGGRGRPTSTFPLT